jgi:hypothetical protein
MVQLIEESNSRVKCSAESAQVYKAKFE